MKRLNIALLILMLLLTSNADAIRLPLDGSWAPSQGFGAWNSCWGGYHLGEDVVRSSEVAVYAIAPGHVFVSALKSGYGYVIIIQHQVNGITFCSLYGHLRDAGRVQAGVDVSEGQVIGYLSANPDYNNGTIHLHSGIRLGGYVSNNLYQRKPSISNCEITGYSWQWNWQYPGYTRDANTTERTTTPYDITHAQMRDQWRSTEEFVASSIASYSCQWVSQNPSGVVYLHPGETYTFSVTFRNTGTTTWLNNGDYNDPNECELRGCLQNGTQSASWLYPGDGIWLSNTGQRVVCATSNVAPQGTGTFTFTGKVPANAVPDLYRVYFRPHHATGGMLSGWGGMHFQVQVVNPPPAAIPVWPVPGDYDGDGHADIAFIDHRGTGSLRIDYASNGYGGIDAQYPNYGTTPGIWSCQAEYDGDGKVDFAQLNRDYQHGTLQINYASNGFATGFDQMLDWYGTSYEIIPCPADYNGDGIGDYAQLDRLGTGVWRINYGPNFVDGFQDTFPYYGTAATIFPCPADYDGDGSSDIATLDRSATGHLKINYAANGFASGFEVDYGWYGESPLIIPYPADYNGDGVGDYAQFDRSTGYYSVNYGPNIANGFEEMLPNYGISEYLYGAPRDYDGDGKDDIATFDQVTCVYAINYASNGFVTGHDVFLNYTAALSGYLKVATDDHPPDLPVTFTLAQNYPNPFNPVTTIAYRLPTATHVTLEVFNILGQKVSTLVDEDQAAGDYLVTWDAARHASGVYLYRITTGEAVETKKMLLRSEN